MVDVKITCLVDAQAQVGEGPVWDPVEEVLWWTDINGRAMHRFDPRQEKDRHFDLGIRVGCFALRETGDFVLAAEHGFWRWSPDDAKAEHLFDVESDRPHNRMNDGGCDRQGRLFASTMNLNRPDARPAPAGVSTQIFPLRRSPMSFRSAMALPSLRPETAFSLRTPWRGRCGFTPMTSAA